MAIVQSAFMQVQVTSRIGGSAGNNIGLASSISTNAQITATTSGANLSGGQAASILAPGTEVSIFGTNLADAAASADMTQQLPIDLGGVEVYFDGIRSSADLCVSPDAGERPDPVGSARTVRTRRA